MGNIKLDCNITSSVWSNFEVVFHVESKLWEALYRKERRGMEKLWHDQHRSYFQQRRQVEFRWFIQVIWISSCWLLCCFELQVDKEIVLLSVLKEPVSRSIFDYVLRSKDITSLFRHLHLRQKKRTGALSECPPPEDPAIAQLLKKLLSQVIGFYLYFKSQAWDSWALYTSTNPDLTVAAVRDSQSEVLILQAITFTDFSICLWDKLFRT